MKNYKEIAFIAAYDSETLLDKLNHTIDEFQKQGCEVEVHYAPTNGQLTALIISYEKG